MAHGDKRKQTDSKHVSANSDNRRFCVAIQRQKYCYETYEKAKRACEYSDNPQRIYYCKFCCAYHTTRFLSRSRFLAGDEPARNEEILQRINKRIQKRKTQENPTLSNANIQFLSTQQQITYNNLSPEARARMRVANYHPILIKHLLKSLAKTTSASFSIPKEEIEALINDVVLDANNEKMKEAIAETLRWDFSSQSDALKFLIRYYATLLEEFSVQNIKDFETTVLDLEKIKQMDINHVTGSLYCFLEGNCLLIIQATSNTKTFKIFWPKKYQ